MSMYAYPGVSAVVTTVNAFLPVVTTSRFPKQHTSIHIRLLQKHLPFCIYANVTCVSRHLFTIHLMYVLVDSLLTRLLEDTRFTTHVSALHKDKRICLTCQLYTTLKYTSSTLVSALH